MSSKYSLFKRSLNYASINFYVFVRHCISSFQAWPFHINPLIFHLLSLTLIARDSSAVVEQVTRNPKNKGLNLASAGTHRKGHLFDYLTSGVELTTLHFLHKLRMVQ
jgi:hypothetical protein